MLNYSMKRFATFLDWLNHHDWPPETQSPIRASAAASLVSFLLILGIDGRVVSLLGNWWAEFLVYSFVPLLLAFVILYRSSWHRELGATARTFLAALLSTIILGGVLITMGIAVVLLGLVYISHFQNFTAFHY
jgi:hypothetical protein